MAVPRAFASLLRGPVLPGASEQAFPFLTVDERGFPHTALLSRAEVDVTSDGHEVVVALASTRSGANVRRSGRAALIAVGEVTAHYAKLTLTRTVEWEGLLGAAFEVADHTADSLGIVLSPLSFQATAEIGRLERWEMSARLLTSLGAELPPPA